MWIDLNQLFTLHFCNLIVKSGIVYNAVQDGSDCESVDAMLIMRPSNKGH